MTNKEKIMKLQTYKMYEDEDIVYVERDDVLKLLEPQPCEDCVSRAEAIKEFQIYREYSSNRSNSDWVDRIETVLMHLPPVTPQAEPCEDCISRAEVLKYAQLVRDDEGIVHEMVHVDDIKYATPMTWSGWIPATQPPEPDTAVLLYVKYKSSGQWTYQLGMWNDSKQIWEDWRTPYRLEDDFEIIKWMELPEGYEEGNHER